MKKVAIVITTYNRKELAERCIDSLLKSDFTSFDIYVVDNAGNDGAKQYLKKKFGRKIKAYKVKKNYGGCYGFNYGVHKAFHHRYEYIILCDDDIVVKSDTISYMYDFISNHPEAGVVGPRTHHMADQRLMQEYGTYLRWGSDYNIWVDNYSKLWSESECEPYIYVDYIPACFMMVRESVMRKVDGVPTYYGGYFEDIDLGHKAILLGYKIAVDSRAVINHGKVSTNGSIKATTVKDYFMNRAKVLFFSRFTPNSEIEHVCRLYLERMYEMLMTARFRGDDNTFRITLMAYIDGFRGKTGALNNKFTCFEKKAYSRFGEVVKGKENIMIDHFRDEYFLSDLVRVSTGNIYIKSDKYEHYRHEIERFGFSEADMDRVKPYDESVEYDLHIRFYNWLGDAPFDTDCTYIDWYKNVAQTEDEKKFFIEKASEKADFVQMYLPSVLQEVLFNRKKWYKNGAYDFLSEARIEELELDPYTDRIVEYTTY